MLTRKKKLTKYYANIYLHFLTECLKSHEKNVQFRDIQVSIRTNELLPICCKKMLSKFGVAVLGVLVPVIAKKSCLSHLSLENLR